jgi:anti-sigma factor RsiW
MKCHRAQDRLVALLDGELAADVAEELRAHLATCDRCRALYERQAAVAPRPALVVPPQVRSQLFARLDAALDAAWDEHVHAEQRAAEPTAAPAPANRPLVWAMAYAVLLAVVTGWGVTTWLENQALRAELAANTATPRSLFGSELPGDAFQPASFVVAPESGEPPPAP